jgi:arylsulfatase A-like enzyme
MNQQRIHTIGRKALPAMLLPLLAAQDADAQKRPNIIHIMSDDHSYQAISAYRHPLAAQAPTPNIDRLAAEGVRFDRAYVENSLSTPSRACLMTGLYSHQNGQKTLGKGIDTTKVFVSELLQEAGYQTGLIGKWHMKCEPKGFDHYLVYKGQGEYYDPGFKSENSQGKYIHEEGYSTDLVTEHAVDFIQQRDTTKPFCLFVHHKAPHRNWLPAMEYLKLYEDVEFPLPETFYDDYETRGDAAHRQRMHIGRDMHLVYDLKVHELADSLAGNDRWQLDIMNYTLAALSKEDGEKWLQAYADMNRRYLDGGMSVKELYEWKYQRYVKDYLRCIKSVDDSVGEILKALEEEGILDETVVVYTSDQGFYMGEHGWFDKRFMYEESFRTPLVIRYPELVKGGSVSQALVQNIDFAPTYLDLAEVKVPASMEGRSMKPLLERDGKEPSRWRKYLYYHFYDNSKDHNVSRHDGISDKRYKLIHFYGPDGSYDELYDLMKDPSELQNVIDNPEYAKVRARLEKSLSRLRKRLEVREF